MDACEVIVVEDSPPSSPAPERITNTSNDIEMSSTNDTLSWSQFTAKFINTTMNSVMLNKEKLVNDNGYKTINVSVYNNANTITNNYTHLQRQYQSQFSKYKPVNSYNYDPNTLPPSYQNMTHSIEITNSYSYYPVNKNNTPLPTDKKQTKTNSYYFDNAPSQTPLRLTTFEQNIAELRKFPDITIRPVTCNKDTALVQPEYIDIDAYYNRNIDALPSNVQTHHLLKTTKDKIKTTMCSPAFLNEQRTASFDKMINGEASQDISIRKVTNNAAEDSDDSDIVFIGEYKSQEPKIVDNISVNKSEIKLEPKRPEIREETGRNTTNSSPAPRRNPKRQVQYAKKAVTSFNEILLTSKNKFKSKKPNNKDNNKKSATADKNLRRSLRTKLNCGAVYCPPSPIRQKHLRDWPVDGMHERPEYNPVTNTIEPFDSYIRNVSPAKPYAISNNNTPTPKLEETNTLAQLCHDMLHHVLAYVATVKAMQDQEDERKMLHETDNNSKMNFLTNLALEKTDSFDERIWKVLTDTVKNINNPKLTDSKFIELRDLIENSILLYCFTNNVSRSNVSKYIANINPADVMQLSNEKFGLSQ